MSAPRRPYVGEGADGCYRSADIDRSEADGYALDDPRREERLASARAWEAQAALYELEPEPFHDGSPLDHDGRPL
jgi:hypothetical protein